MEIFVAIAVVILFVLVLDQRQKLRYLDKTVRELAARSGPVAPQAQDIRQGADPVAAATSVAAAAGAGASADITAPLPPKPADNDLDTPAVRELQAAYKALVQDEPSVASAPVEQVAAPVAPTAPVTPTTPGPPTLAKAKPPKERKSFSFNFEDLFGRKLPIWAGGITLIVAGVLIVKYAIDAGLLTPWTRIIGGLLFGGGLIAGAEFAHAKGKLVDDPRVQQALSGAGIATLYATALMAHNVYGLIGPFAAFALMAAITAGALWLSLRFGAPSALLGLAGGLATPALVGSMQPNVPLLTAYLALTIGALTAVSKRQKWMWLGVAALIGGGLWSVLLIVTGGLGVLESLSLASLVLVLSLALPFFMFADTRHALFRAGAAGVGAAQIALLVAMGGFTPLNWALFILIAVAVQWLVHYNKEARSIFGLLQLTSLALSVLLLLIWPDPSTGALALVGGILLIIHAAPLYPRLWRDGRDWPVAQWAAMGVAIMVVAVRHVPVLIGELHIGLAAVCAGAALFTLAPVATGWSKVRALAADKAKHFGLALLVAVAAFLALVSAQFGVASWALPIAAAIIAAAALELVRRAGNTRAAFVPALYALIAPFFLGIASIWDEFERIFGVGESISAQSFIRWFAIAAMASFFVWRAVSPVQRKVAAGAAALFGYCALAQIVPATALPLVAPLFILAIAVLVSRKADQPSFSLAVPALGVSALITLLWSAGVVLVWNEASIVALSGEPALLSLFPSAAQTLRQLAAPALIIAAALWLMRRQITSKIVQIVVSVAVAAALVVALHIFYRQGFAAIAGADFVATGMMQRAIWAALLIGSGWLAARTLRHYQPFSQYLALGLVSVGTLYLTYFSLFAHNPLWNDQAVGSLPLINALLPTYGLIFLGLWLIQRVSAGLFDGNTREAIDQGVEIGRMGAIILFAYSTLAQLFHGNIFYNATLDQGENILRSILAIALAIGFLLWGIKTKRRSWRIASLVLMLVAVGKVFIFDASGLTGLIRIASFIALGFSLIGIGWLYSRQLRAEPSAQKPQESAE